jgi:hypothetical protein
MRDHDLEQIQSDLDMQLLTQMEMERNLRSRMERERHGNRRCPRRPRMVGSPFVKFFNTVVFILLVLVFLNKLEMLFRGL